MPEFIMPVDLNDLTWTKLDAFTQGYIEAMFFTSTGSLDDGDLQDAAFTDFADGEVPKIIEDCRAFQAANAPQLEHAYESTGVGYDEAQAGRDYWYSRNGHGVGFWDRGLGSVGDDLHKACRHQEVTLCRGDDGRIYLV